MIATMIPTIALSFLAFLLPESPKWQLVNGKLDLAEKTVREAMKVRSGAVYLSQGFADHVLGSCPRPNGLYCSYPLPRQALATQTEKNNKI